MNVMGSSQLILDQRIGGLVKMKEYTYDSLRKLAIVDVKRRLNTIKHLSLAWDIVDNTHSDNTVEKTFSYDPASIKFTNITMNEYATIREIKYIVWRFRISKSELGD